MDIEFRIAKKEDVGEIIKLCNECFGENSSEEYALKQFDEKNDQQIYLLGVTGGYCCFSYSDQYYSDLF